MASALKNSPDHLDDATSGNSTHGGTSRRLLSPDAQATVRTELEGVMHAIGRNDVESARRTMEALPRVSEEAEGRYLLSLLAAPIQKYFTPESLLHMMSSYYDGDLAFAPDLSKISFVLTPEKQRLLDLGFEIGALSGPLITAYPSAEQVDIIAQRLAKKKGTAPSIERDILLNMPVTEFLARHFIARGGIIGTAVAGTEECIDEWAALRWPADPMTFPALWKKGARNVARVYETLPEQPCLRDVLGTSTLSFTSMEQNVDHDVPLLNATGCSSLGQGVQLAFDALMGSHVSFLNAPEFLALVTLSKPQDITTYPSGRGEAERIAAISKGGVASAAMLFSTGLQLGWGSLESGSNFRARSAVR